MNEPRTYTRTETAQWLQFDAESDPATWPQGVIKSSQVPRCWILHLRLDDGGVKSLHYVNHGDMIRVVVIGGMSSGVWKAVGVMSREQWERRGWIPRQHGHTDATTAQIVERLRERMSEDFLAAEAPRLLVQTGLTLLAAWEFIEKITHPGWMPGMGDYELTKARADATALLGGDDE